LQRGIIKRGDARAVSIRKKAPHLGAPMRSLSIGSAADVRQMQPMFAK
jgi:hypothetical protein